jgi:uncharacterized protein YndB with AHSA1/START domain
MTRTDTASRLIDVAADRVYAALLDSDALVAWLPPAGMTGRFDRFDPRPGGGYRLVLAYDDAGSEQAKSGDGIDVVEARFIELVPGERVVQEVDFESDDPAYAGTMTMAWELFVADGGTRVTITATEVPDGVSVEDHAAGLSSSLANLAAYLDG